VSFSHSLLLFLCLTDNKKHKTHRAPLIIIYILNTSGSVQVIDTMWHAARYSPFSLCVHSNSLILLFVIRTAVSRISPEDKLLLCKNNFLSISREINLPLMWRGVFVFCVAVCASLAANVSASNMGIRANGVRRRYSRCQRRRKSFEFIHCVIVLAIFAHSRAHLWRMFLFRAFKNFLYIF